MENKFKPNKTGVLKFTKKYKQMLLDSGDDDYILLAELEGQRIQFMTYPQIAIDKSMIMVNVSESFEGQIPHSCLKEIEDIR